MDWTVDSASPPGVVQAVLVWALAMFGMGGSIDRLADDPSLRQPLPPPGAPAEERLGPFARYADIAARPLFTDNRRPQPFVIDPMGEAESTGGFDYTLTSVLRTPAMELVILQPAAGGDPVRVKLGEAPEAAPAPAPAAPKNPKLAAKED